MRIQRVIHSPITFTPYTKTGVDTRRAVLNKETKDTVSFGVSRLDRNYETVFTNIPHNICARCGNEMVSENFFNKEYFKDYEIPASSLIKKLKPMETQMHRVERKVFRTLEKLARKNKEMTLRELFNRKYYLHLSSLEVKQMKILNKIYSMDLDLSPQTGEALIETLEKTRAIMFTEGRDVGYKRRRILGNFMEIRDKYPEKDELSTVYNIMQELPSSRNDVDSFFVKYSHLDSRGLFFKLIENSKATIEHARSQYDNGPDDMSNFLVLCRRCNSIRNTEKYVNFVDDNSQMLVNAQRYIDRIIEYLNKHPIYGLEDYPQKIKETVFKESGGKINLDISKYKSRESNISQLLEMFMK